MRIFQRLDDGEAYVRGRMMLALALYGAGRYCEGVLQCRKYRDTLGTDLERGHPAYVVCSRAWLAFMEQRSAISTLPRATSMMLSESSNRCAGTITSGFGHALPSAAFRKFATTMMRS